MDLFHIIYNIALILILFGFLFLNRRSSGSIISPGFKNRLGRFLPGFLRRAIGRLMRWVEGISGRGLVARTIKHRKRETSILIALAWLSFILIVLVYLLNIGTMARLYDIDDAEQAAAVSYLNGGNPYSADTMNQTIPRFSGGSTIDPNRPMELGNFNYLPLDLFAYTFFYQVFQPLTGYWFASLNAVLGFLVFLIFKFTFPDSKMRYTGFFFVFCTLILLFDNTMFTMLLIAMGFYVDARSSHPRKELFAAFFFFLACLTKVFPIVLLSVYLLYYLQKKWSRRQAICILVFAGICSIFVYLAMEPFGFQNVVRSALLFHSEPAVREVSTAIGGTLLYATLSVTGLISYYSIVFVALLALLMLFTQAVDGLLDRIIISGTCLMFLILNDAMAPFVIPIYAAYVYYYAFDPASRLGKSSFCSGRRRRR